MQHTACAENKSSVAKMHGYIFERVDNIVNIISTETANLISTKFLTNAPVVILTFLQVMLQFSVHEQPCADSQRDCCTIKKLFSISIFSNAPSVNTTSVGCVSGTGRLMAVNTMNAVDTR